jgi:hypothetical protein
MIHIWVAGYSREELVKCQAADSDIHQVQFNSIYFPKYMTEVPENLFVGILTVTKIQELD